MLASIFESIFGPRIKDDQEFVRTIYRSHISKLLPTTTYTSDSGWGCMLRVVQMTLANLICKRQGASPSTVIPLCWDNSTMPFSIQTLTSECATLFPYKKPCEWFTPSQGGFLLQKVLQKFNLTYRVIVFNDGSIFLNEISRDKDNIVILAMARIGLDKPEPEYLEALSDIMESQRFFAILGGTPRYAHLFLKQKNGYMGYLDPHETKKAASSQEELLNSFDQYTGQLQWIKRDRISSSMCIMFVMKRQQVDEFWKEMQLLKQNRKEQFFLYLSEQRPQVGSNDIIQINDFEE